MRFLLAVYSRLPDCGIRRNAAVSCKTHEGLVSDLKTRFTPGTLQSHYLSKIEATGAEAADFV